MTSEEFDELARVNALLESAQPRLHPQRLRCLLDELRLTGEYRRLLARAREKQRTLTAHGIENPGVEETGLTGEALFDWFYKRLPPPGPDNFETHAAVLEFAHKHTTAFMRALAREYCYLRLRNQHTNES